MEYTEHTLNVLTAKSYSGVEREWIVANIHGGEDYKTIVDRLNQSMTREIKVSYSEFEQRRDAYEKMILQRLKPYCDGMVARGDTLFPPLRGKAEANEIPVFLYYLGDISLLQSKDPCVAVIGLRTPTNAIEMRERAIVRQLVQRGAITLSGLALGCDTIAHRETLKNGGKTVAILPSPLSQILPEANIQLVDLIVENGGLVLTEYGNEASSRDDLVARYIARDRLQALLADTVVLAASYAKDSSERPNNSHLKEEKLDSGARFAISAALRYSIPRAAMYDAELDATNAMFDLNRDIIQDDATVIAIAETERTSAIEKIILNARAINS